MTQLTDLTQPAAPVALPQLKIAWFGHIASERHYGTVSYSRMMLSGLSQRAVEVVFFFHATRERHLITPPNVRAVRIGALDILNRATVSSLRAERTIKNVLRNERPQLAHVSLSFSNLDSSIPELAHEYNIPCIATIHMPFGPPRSFWGAAMRVIYRMYVSTLEKYDVVIVFSENQKRMLEKNGVEHAQIHVIPNGVDIDKFAPGESDYKRELGARVLISYVGRIEPEKNVNVLCEAFTSLDLPDDHVLVLAGGGMDLGRLRRKYSDDPRIIFRGHLSDAREIQRLLRASDINVLPSAIEGLSISMLEAMASGCAMIVTDVGADGEAMRGAGLVLDLENLDGQLPLALRQLIEFPEFREELRRRSRQRAVEQYSLRGNLDKLVDLYRQLERSARPSFYAYRNQSA
ncbi:MAG: glycosyltransferase family 4 protein [Anaerolineae bacterium]|nr:glycosyltransferase family 4 protein [Anaerolineae bacterium]